MTGKSGAGWTVVWLFGAVRNANGKFLKRELKEVLDPASAD